jgi:RNA polymerase sigma-54 factor
VSHNGTGASISRAQVASVKPSIDAPFTIEQLREGIEIVRQMDPIGVAARDLRECLLLQLRDLERKVNNRVLNGDSELQNQNLAQIQAAMSIIDTQLRNVQNRQYKDISRAIGRPLDTVMQALDFLRTLDPKPGQRYNQVEPRLIEPDVAFVKQSDEYVVMMNEDDIPVLRLNPGYKKLLNREAAEKDVRNYVKERYKSAIQLMKNIEQRKQTILKTCYAIIGRQREFLDYGIDHLKPMMIKEVAEEIGVHPSTVSRAVANKYVHTSQGVYELRYFFSESVNGPEGGGTSLMILKRRVKKLIDEEDARRPLTDEQITRILQSQGINVTRRTVAKYREDMKIPSTHQRRVKD